VFCFPAVILVLLSFSALFRVVSFFHVCSFSEVERPFSFFSVLSPFWCLNVPFSRSLFVIIFAHTLKRSILLAFALDNENGQDQIDKRIENNPFHSTTMIFHTSSNTKDKAISPLRKRKSDFSV
jgi:hypothetical protein